MGRLLLSNVWRTAIIVSIAVLIGLAAFSAIWANQGPDESIRSPAISKSAGTQTKIHVVTETADFVTSSAVYVDVTGATTSITVPSGENATILARFSAESDCTGPAGSWCSAQIFIGASLGDPNSGTDFAFDSPPSSEWESHSMERVKNVGPGTYTVKVQVAVVSGATSFRVDDWTLTVERHQRVS